MNKNLRPFHLAIPVKNLTKAKKFYVNTLGCSIGRSNKNWIDFNFFGHQLVIHLSNNKIYNINNDVDKHLIPVPHFGIILKWDDWNEFSNKLKDNINFIIKPHIRFKGKIGEQATLFFKDPDGNAIEFKAFKNDQMIFNK